LSTAEARLHGKRRFQSVFNNTALISSDATLNNSDVASYNSGAALHVVNVALIGFNVALNNSDAAPYNSGAALLVINDACNTFTTALNKTDDKQERNENIIKVAVLKEGVYLIKIFSRVLNRKALL
jgi:hypothetical protein